MKKMMKECKASMEKEGRKEMRGTGRRDGRVIGGRRRRRERSDAEKDKVDIGQNKVDEREEGTAITNENRKQKNNENDMPPKMVMRQEGGGPGDGGRCEDGYREGYRRERDRERGRDHIARDG